MSAAILRLAPPIVVMSLTLAVSASGVEPDRWVALPEIPIVGSFDELASLPPPPPEGLDPMARAAYYDARAEEYTASARSSCVMADAARLPGLVAYGKRYVVRYYRLQARALDEAADRSRTLASTHREQAPQATAKADRAPQR